MHSKKNRKRGRPGKCAKYYVTPNRNPNQKQAQVNIIQQTQKKKKKPCARTSGKRRTGERALQPRRGDSTIKQRQGHEGPTKKGGRCPRTWGLEGEKEYLVLNEQGKRGEISGQPGKGVTPRSSDSAEQRETKDKKVSRSKRKGNEGRERSCNCRWTKKPKKLAEKLAPALLPLTGEKSNIDRGRGNPQGDQAKKRKKKKEKTNCTNNRIREKNHGRRKVWLQAGGY